MVKFDHKIYKKKWNTNVKNWVSCVLRGGGWGGRGGGGMSNCVCYWVGLGLCCFAIVHHEQYFML